ncbi:FAD-dependent oxidoreductase [Flavobacterium sp. 9R]|uniref:NAD(P)/FAD-dependent oxidoreductase n=1 Tax=Flavobacterium sp. 9R TaxID=2653143 RepID=UPI0012EF5BDE|nr:FAD-dependent oxidoreductase [Flavobacterium sp. 9R]VXB97184.1 FAD-dependent oxidoreductase [Flavobacterium sp. 9R]
MVSTEVVIIGGGLAGLTAGIHLSQKGISVTIIEKNEYPKHKVCGEYVSNEVRGYLESLAIPIQSAEPTAINQLEFETLYGARILQKLPLGGFGISRFTLDFIMYKKAIENGCTIINQTVENCRFDENHFIIETIEKSIYKAQIVLGAYGKRAQLDYSLKRTFIIKKSPWLGVKNHYKGQFSDNLVGLYHFKGGYCGVSKVENDTINICYLTNYSSFQKYKNIASFEKEVLFKNKRLKQILENSVQIFEKPLTISQISFEKKEPVSEHMLMIGDTAGLIHPLCGNGMAMAIHSAKIASELCVLYLNEKKISRNELEKRYSKAWNLNFKKRLAMGRVLSTILVQQTLTLLVLQIVVLFPFVLKQIIKRTHGNPL